MLLHTAHLLNFLFTAYILRTFLGSQTFSKFSHFLVELPFYEQCIGIDTPHVPQSRSIIQTMSSPDASLNTPVDHWSSPSSDIPSRTFANELATFQFTNSVTLSSAPPPTVSAFRIAAAASAFVIVAAVVVSYSLIKRCSFEPSRMVQGSDPLPTPSKCQKRAGTTLGTPGSESLVTMLATLCMDSPLNARVDIVNAPVAVVNGEIKDPFESFGVASYPTSAIFGTIPSPGQGSSTIKDRTRSFSPYTLQPTADEGLQILLIGTTETLGDPDYETDSQSCQWKLKTPKSVRYTQLGRSTRSPTPRNRSRVEKTNAEDSSRCVFPRSGYIARPEETLVTATRKFKENSLQHVQVEDAPLAGITITPTSPQPISGTMEWDIPSRATAHPKHRENIPATVISSKADIASAEENRMSVTPENFEATKKISFTLFPDVQEPNPTLSPPRPLVLVAPPSIRNNFRPGERRSTSARIGQNQIPISVSEEKLRSHVPVRSSMQSRILNSASEKTLRPCVPVRSTMQSQIPNSVSDGTLRPSPRTQRPISTSTSSTQRQFRNEKMHEIQSPTSSSKRSRKPSCCADCDTVKRKQMDGATVQFRAPFEHVFTQRIPLCNPEGRCPTAHMREFIAMSNGNNSRMLAAMRAGASTTIPAMPPSPTNAEPPTSPRDKSDETRSPAPSLRYTSSRACYLSPSVPPTAGVKDYAHHDRPTSLVFDDEDYEDNEDTPRPKSRIIRYR